MCDYGTLNAQGAELLRRTRDAILATPDRFNMSAFCGTQLCIGGHMGWLMGQDVYGESVHYMNIDLDAIMRYCGVLPILNFRGRCDDKNHPFFDLFFRWTPGEGLDAAAAADRINAFLWKYGYPPTAVTDPAHDERETSETRSVGPQAV